MAQVLEEVCSRCGADFCQTGDAYWRRGERGLWCHLCPDNYMGSKAEVDISASRRPMLAEEGVSQLMTQFNVTNANTKEVLDRMADGLLLRWHSRGIGVEMTDDEDVAPRFINLTGPSAREFGEQMTPPTNFDAELLMEFCEPLRRVLAARGSLRQAKKKHEPAGSEKSKEADAQRPHDETVPVTGGSSAGKTGAIDLDAPPKYKALGFAGISEAISGCEGTIPPLTKCPSCQAVEVFRFWERPLSLNDEFQNRIEIPIIYHCTKCGRDDLYGGPITTVPGSGHPAHLMYPHYATCWPDRSYRPDSFRSPSKQITLIPKAIEALEVDPSTDESESDWAF